MPTPTPMLARNYGLSINTGTDAAPVFTKISGITSINPSQTSTLTDDTDFDTNGWESGTVAMRGRSLSVAVNYKEDPTTTPAGAQDPGQVALLALGEAQGPSGKKTFKYVSPNGRGWSFKATVDVAFPGGGKTDNANFTAEIKMDGPPTAVVPV